MSQQTQKPSIITLLMLVALASVSAAMYTPAIPVIQQFFGISGSAVQLTMTVFLIGYVIGQLVYAPLGKAYGRKKTLFIGLAIAIVGSLLCVFSGPMHSFNMMLIGRITLALGSSAGLCIAFMIIHDVFEGEEARRASIMVTMAFAILPSISVFIGGLLTHYINWESTFIVLVFYMVLVGLISLRLPETGGKDKGYQIRPMTIIRDYVAVSKNVVFVLYSGLWGLTTAAVYIFATSAPSVAVDGFGLTPADFGTLNLAVSASLLVGIFVNLKLSHYLSARQSIFYGSLIALAATLFMSACYITHTHVAWEFFTGICVMYFGFAMVLPNAAALGGAASIDKASGSAMMTFINMLVAVVLQWIVSLFSSQLYLAVVVAFFSLAIGLFVIQGLVLFAERSHPKA